jgi:hypothetical protein
LILDFLKRMMNSKSFLLKVCYSLNESVFSADLGKSVH